MHRAFSRRPLPRSPPSGFPKTVNLPNLTASHTWRNLCSCESLWYLEKHPDIVEQQKCVRPLTDEPPAAPLLARDSSKLNKACGQRLTNSGWMGTLISLCLIQLVPQNFQSLLRTWRQLCSLQRLLGRKQLSQMNQNLCPLHPLVDVVAPLRVRVRRLLATTALLPQSRLSFKRQSH